MPAAAGRAKCSARFTLNCADSPTGNYKFLASNLFKNIVEKLLYAFWRGESRAYAFTARAWGNGIGIMGWDSRRILSLQAMGWDSTLFGEENPEPTGNGMGLYAFWRGEIGESRAYGQWVLNGMGLYAFWRGESLAYRQWDGTLRLLARRIPSLRVYCKGPGQEFRLCFCFVKIHISSAAYTVSSLSQVEENSGQLTNAPKQ